jgi:hypothetical protein
MKPEMKTGSELKATDPVILFGRDGVIRSLDPLHPHAGHFASILLFFKQIFTAPYCNQRLTLFDDVSRNPPKGPTAQRPTAALELPISSEPGLLPLYRDNSEPLAGSLRPRES